ncbi:MAG: hypothetical protein JRF30_03020 [Deltaproteobacteria bacterium]|nr:hypothetical protein [Deltaproteobacteria bacterium]MBW2329907.1 hypothetical protein [Deltaproteobacteria bacterium]
MEQVIDIYTKKANLYRLKINRPVKELYEIPETELKNYPIVRERGTRPAVSLVGDKRFKQIRTEPYYVRDILRKAICQAVEKIPGLVVEDDKRVKIIKKASMLKEYGAKTAVIYPCFKSPVWEINGQFYLCIDYEIKVKNHLKADEIFSMAPDFQIGHFSKGFYKTEEGWEKAKFCGTIDKQIEVYLPTKGIYKVAPENFLPDLPVQSIIDLLERKGAVTTINRDIKQLALLTVDKPPKQRLERTTRFAQELRDAIFPIKIGEYEINLEPSPAKLLSPEFEVRDNLEESASSFDHDDATKSSMSIINGLTTFGAYEKPRKNINIALLTRRGKEDQMEQIVEQTNDGSFRYRGMSETFCANLIVKERMVTDDFSEYKDECHALIRGPNAHDIDVVLFYVPEKIGRASYNSPYYETKKLLLKSGIVSQCLDEDTLQSPKFKDLGLALNIFAKAGHAPWVLESGFDDVDLFIGLSYSSVRLDNGIKRIMGYVNVFDRFGRWKFYHGNAEAFRYEDRDTYFKSLIKDSIIKYKAQYPNRQLRRIEIHYTQKFRREDKESIFQAARAVLPDCEIAFVWINLHSPVRLFDESTPDGSFPRGDYVILNDNQFLLATTGANMFKEKGMGTPRILNVTTSFLPEKEEVDLQPIAQHILSLTRLNWASTRSFSHEPITTKYARDIAYLMNVFMLDENFSLNDRVTSKPWFL